jgi:bacillithiol biosynthesis cysteine-adding enzyme BshC
MIRVRAVPADAVGAPPADHARLGLEIPPDARSIPRPSSRLEARERAALARALEEHLAPLAPHVAVLDAVRSLVDLRACAVVTGQQPGFLASPLYSLYKALQAIRLARVLREQWKAPVVALFWNHADDHDVAEVHHAHFVNKNLDLQKVALAGLSSGRQPFSRIRIREQAQGLASIRALIGQFLEGAPFTARALEIFVPRDGETLAGAFTRSLTELLGPLGLAVIEPDWIRPSLSQELARIVDADPARHLELAASRLRERGVATPIDPSEAALVYAHDAQGRRALRKGGDGFRFDGEDGSRTGSELAAEIVQDPLAWSPGALLRPIVQDLCLPVAAYVGGEGELAYHAELPDLRARVGAPATPFVPRVSCTLVDPECRISLGKLGLAVEDVLRSRGTRAIEEETSADAPHVVSAMRSVGEAAAKSLEALRDDLAALDPALLSQLQRAASQMRSAGDWIAEKAERVHQNKSGKGRRHVRRLENMLCPGGELQERVLGPLGFVARFGETWPAELADAIDPFAAVATDGRRRSHLVVELGDEYEGGSA